MQPCRLLRARLWLAVLILLALCQLAHAADAVATLPLHGYYHPGRFQPLHIIMTGESGVQSARVNAGGSLSVEFPLAQGQADLVTPWLCYDDRVGTVALQRGQNKTTLPLQFRPLPPEQRLLAYATGDSAQAMALGHALFGSAECVTVDLPAGQPLTGPAAAWETADLLVLDRSPALLQSLPNLTQTIIPMGVTLAVRDTPASVDNVSPDPQWPWRHINIAGAGYWILTFTPDGPDGTYNADVYRTVSHWQPRWPANFRRQALLIAVGFSVVLLAILLWRPSPKITFALVLICCGAAVGITELWRGFHWPVMTCGGDVLLMPATSAPGAGPHSAPLFQVDSWSFHAAPVTSFVDCRWASVTKPIFASEANRAAFAPILYCAEDGQPHAMRFFMPAGEKFALLQRTAGPRAPAVRPSMPVTSQLMPLVNMAYLHEGDTLLGQYEANPSATMGFEEQSLWPAVVIQRGGLGTSVPGELGD